MALLVTTSARGTGAVFLVVFILIVFPIAFGLLVLDYYQRRARHRPFRRPRPRPPEMLPRRPRVVRRGGRRR